jgi:hypothetical protein
LAGGWPIGIIGEQQPLILKKLQKKKLGVFFGVVVELKKKHERDDKCGGVCDRSDSVQLIFNGSVD